MVQNWSDNMRLLLFYQFILNHYLLQVSSTTGNNINIEISKNYELYQAFWMLKVRSLFCYKIYLMSKIRLRRKSRILKALGKIFKISRTDTPRNSSLSIIYLLLRRQSPIFWYLSSVMFKWISKSCNCSRMSVISFYGKPESLSNTMHRFLPDIYLYILKMLS